MSAPILGYRVDASFFQKWESIPEALRSRAIPLVAAGVMASEGGRVQRLRDAIEGECDGLSIDERLARAILEFVDGVIACSFPDCNCPPDAEGDVHCPKHPAFARAIRAAATKDSA